MSCDASHITRILLQALIRQELSYSAIFTRLHFQSKAKTPSGKLLPVTNRNMSTKGYNQPTLVSCAHLTSNTDSTTAKTPGSFTERSASGMPGIASGLPTSHMGGQSQVIEEPRTPVATTFDSYHSSCAKQDQQSSVARSRPRHPAHLSHIQGQRKYGGRDSLNKRSQPHWRPHPYYIPDSRRRSIRSTSPTGYHAADGAIVRHHTPVRGRTDALSSDYTDPAAQLQAKADADKFLSELASELSMTEVLRTSHISSPKTLSREDLNASPSVLHASERPCTKGGSVTEEVTDHNTKFEPAACCEDTTATEERLRLQHTIRSLEDEIEGLRTGLNSRRYVQTPTFVSLISL